MKILFFKNKGDITVAVLRSEDNFMKEKGLDLIHVNGGRMSLFYYPKAKSIWGQVYLPGLKIISWTSDDIEDRNIKGCNIEEYNIHDYIFQYWTGLHREIVIVYRQKMLQSSKKSKRGWEDV